MNNGIVLLTFFLTSFTLHSQTEPYILEADQGVELERGFGPELKATPGTTDSLYLFTVTIKPRGFRTPVHKQPSDMSFYVLEGQLSVFFDSTIHELTTGQYAFIPHGTPVAFSSTGKDGAKWVHVFSSGEGMLDFWKDQSDIGKSMGDPSEKNKAIIGKAPDYGIEYVGPSPFGK